MALTVSGAQSDFPIHCEMLFPSSVSTQPSLQELGGNTVTLLPPSLLRCAGLDPRSVPGLGVTMTVSSASETSGKEFRGDMGRVEPDTAQSRPAGTAV